MGQSQLKQKVSKTPSQPIAEHDGMCLSPSYKTGINRKNHGPSQPGKKCETLLKSNQRKKD
jgi:hypothetical protein